MPHKHANTDISYADCAKTLSVSTASILNWVKNGELKSNRRGFVDAQSLKHFKNQIAGQTRLHSRANKLYRKNVKPAETPPSVSPAQDSEDQSKAYENRLGEVLQNKEGIYYTPANIIDAMLAKIPGDVSDLSFLDPCCGTGNFLLGALRRGFRPENVYGQDCDLAALDIAKARVENIIGQTYDTLSCGDFLSTPLDTGTQHTGTQHYDVIATNPPWGKKYTYDEKKEFAQQFGLTSPIGSSALFSLRAIERVKHGGYVALLLPESCVTIAAFEPLRKRLLNYRILNLQDHGRAFAGLMTKTQSITLCKTDAIDADSIDCHAKGQVYKRPRASFVKQPKSIFNFTTRPDEVDVIDHVFKQPHTTLKDKAVWGLGIVTGSNKTLCRDTPAVGDVPVYKGSNITKTGLKSAKLYLDPDLTQYRQAAPHALYFAKEKLIYRFISNRLVFYHDTQQRLILNSANMLVPEDGFPLTQAQLCFLLNTDLMSFIFQKTFATRKVLRSDLETLPIFHTFFTPKLEPIEDNLLTHLGLIKTQNGYAVA